MSPEAEVELACEDLGPALEILRELGLRLDVIYPADDPNTAVLSRGRTKVRLTTSPGALRPGAEPARFEPEFVLTRANSTAGEGRAGMIYRDLIPGRLGGRYVASHITMPTGGPVSDWVHYHRVEFQMIYVRSGWVRVVYEDQGEPFVMNAGDLVLQPPGIRHRVLESSPGLEVIEIGSPALHETFAEHELELPNGLGDADRSWSGQRFLLHRAASGEWTPFLDGEAIETGMHLATRGIAQVRTVRPSASAIIPFPPNGGELVFGFVLEGCARLDRRQGFTLAAGDCFVIPPHEPWSLGGMSDDFRLLHVTTGVLG
ncbi:MAG TPA: cupin domain-containing protein [Sphingomicrobium sp.]|nr:cupin domain-containing protein [Sphingomicrobium sp.]